MSEDIYAKPDLTKKVRFQTGGKEDGKEDIGEEIDNVVIYDNYWAQGSTLPKSQDNTTDEQQQTTSVDAGSGKRNPHRAAGVFLGLLCLVLLVAAIVLLVFLVQLNNSWNMERNRLQADYTELTCERDQIQTRYSKLEILNHNLTRNISQLEDANNNLTRNISRLEDANNNLTRNISRLEDEKDLLKATNKNLTRERDELQQQIDMPPCPDKWIRFENSCYLISLSRRTWADSKEFCKQQRAELVIISSEEEQKFVSSYRKSTWIGLTDVKTEGQWKWVDETAATTQYWRKGQPDNHQNEEDCAQIAPSDSLKNWNDLPCNYKMLCFCEKLISC